MFFFNWSDFWLSSCISYIGYSDSRYPLVSLDFLTDLVFPFPSCAEAHPHPAPVPRRTTAPSPDPQRPQQSSWLQAAALASSGDEGQARWEQQQQRRQRDEELRLKPVSDSRRIPEPRPPMRVSSPLGLPQRAPAGLGREGDEALVLEPSRHQQTREIPPGRPRTLATTNAACSPSGARPGGGSSSAERLVLDENPQLPLQRRPGSPAEPPLGRLASASLEGGARSAANSPMAGRPPRAKTMPRGDGDSDVLVLGAAAPSSPSLNSSLGSRSRLAKVWRDLSHTCFR